MSINPVLRQVRDAIRNPLTSLGAYPIYVVLTDGALLCPQCARKNYRLISEQTHNPALDCGWGAIGAEVFWEGADDYCADCGAPLPSAYGDPTIDA